MNVNADDTARIWAADERIQRQRMVESTRRHAAEVSGDFARMDFDYAVRAYLEALARFDGQPRTAAEVATSAGESVAVFVRDGAAAGK